MNDSTIQTQSQTKWYFKPIIVIIAILCIGPFALPLVWLSPVFKKSHKIVLTILLIIVAIGLIIGSIKLYNILLEKTQGLQKPKPIIELRPRLI